MKICKYVHLRYHGVQGTTTKEKEQAKKKIER